MDSRVAYMIDGVCKPITAGGSVRLRAASSGQCWGGLHLEVGESQGNVGGVLLANGHMVSMNPNDVALPIYLRDECGEHWVPHLFQPGTLMIHPEGHPIWVVSPQPSQWSAAIISGAFLDAVSGGHRNLRAAINVDDPVLRHLFWALIEEVNRPSRDETVTRSLVDSFAIAVGSRLGRQAPGGRMGDALKPAQLSRLQTWLSRNLHLHISVPAMAVEAGLSETQFARKFKRTTGYSPWDYVIELRLQRARALLGRGETICNAAAACGFVDQAHLSRLFKRRFHVSPAAHTKQRWRLNRQAHLGPEQTSESSSTPKS